MSVDNLKLPDPRQLPYLLKLLEDDSETVRKEVVRYLASFGPELKGELLKLPATAVLPCERMLEKIVFEQEKERLLQKWSHWQESPTDLGKLENGLTLLAEFLNGLKYSQKESLGFYLNELAAEYLIHAKTNDPLELAKFLFEVKALSGNPNDFYNPQNSNLVYVILHQRGLPISLSCIYMLVGARVGFVIEGYNFPGHFMAKVEIDDKSFIVDGFNHGKIIDEQEMLNHNKHIEEKVRHFVGPATAVDILQRVLNNLINAYQAGGESQHQQFMVELYRTLQPTNNQE